MEKQLKLCLVGSSGGHLAHLYMLKPFWEQYDRFFVTFDKEDAKSMLKEERWFTILPTLPYMYYFSSLLLIPAPKDWVW